MGPTHAPSTPLANTGKSPRYFGGGIIKNFKKEWPLHLLILPALIVTLIFSYGPMWGLVMAFQNFNPARGFWGSDWLGLENFRWLFSQQAFIRTIPNTLIISVGKIIFGTLASVIFSLLLNEVRINSFKRVSQTIVYIPNFISWVIMAGVFQTLLASDGILNVFISNIGFNSVPFLTDPGTFRWTMIWTDVWKTFGFGTVVYLATITSLDPGMYESAAIDGAGRFTQVMKITLPLMGPIIVLMVTLALGNVLNAGFDQIFNLYSPIVYSTGDIIDTYLFRVSFTGMPQFSIGAAVGLMRSVVAAVLISVSLWVAYKVAGYRVF